MHPIEVRGANEVVGPADEAYTASAVSNELPAVDISSGWDDGAS